MLAAEYPLLRRSVAPAGQHAGALLRALDGLTDEQLAELNVALAGSSGSVGDVLRSLGSLAFVVRADRAAANRVADGLLGVRRG